MKRFSMTHSVHGHTVEFDEDIAPVWLTSENTVPGSTKDARWVWQLILDLPVGDSHSTDFYKITRIA